MEKRENQDDTYLNYSKTPFELAPTQVLILMFSVPLYLCKTSIVGVWYFIHLALKMTKIDYQPYSE